MITVKQPQLTRENGISKVQTEVWFDQEKKRSPSSLTVHMSLI